jgi:hypothetical protein
MPVDMDTFADTFKHQLIDLQARLKPTIVVCSGQPNKGITQVLQQIYPTIRFFVVSQDSRHTRLEEADDNLGRRERALGAVAAFNDVFQSYCQDFLPRRGPVEFRFQLHRNYLQSRELAPTQRLYVLRAVTSAGNEIATSAWVFDKDLQQSDILGECMSL